MVEGLREVDDHGASGRPRVSEEWSEAEEVSVGPAEK